MNLSIDLKGTMSPKVTRTGKSAKKTPTILALKKKLRRSSLPDLKRTDIIVIDSSSNSSNDGNEDIQKVINETPLTIPDSDNDDNDENIVRSESLNYNRLSLRETNLKRIINENNDGTKQKNLEICKWLIEISNATTKQQRLTLFSELSTISGGSNPGYKKTGEKIALNSTAQNDLVPRFDQLFRKKSVFPQNDADNLSKHDNEQHKTGTIEDSLMTTTDNDQNSRKKVGSQIDSLGDSFKLQIEETLTKSPLKKKETSPCITTPSNKDIESLLDSIYGDSWRKNQHQILLPSSDTKIPTRKNGDNNKNHRNNKNKTVSEKKTKRQESPTIYKNPYLDTEVVKSKNLLRTLQENRINEKLIASPWTESLKKICDTESDNDSPDRRAIAKKLTFDDDDDNDNDGKSPITDDDDDDDDDDDWLPAPTRQTTTVTTKKSDSYSFLESLSKNIPIDECDVSARIFRSNFKKHKTELADRLFKLYNKEVFNCAIPETTKLEWNSRLTHTAGRCRCKKITHSNGTLERRVVIELSTKVLDSPDRLRDTLIHEMCHAATWIINQVTNGHGEYWKNWALKAMNIFPELPPIRTCHNYALNTKYTYKCKNCSYSFGRHTKSLNLERKRCGYCRGEFDVLINKTTKNGEIKSVPTTPKRPPNGFALFVKEKYSEFKAPELKHSDVMKMLGEEFAKMKLKST